MLPLVTANDIGAIIITTKKKQQITNKDRYN